MAGISTPVYRGLCRQMGATFSYTEMISAKGLIRENLKTGQLLSIWPEEKPVGAQIFGANPEDMAEAAIRVEEAGFDVVDVNMGCPVRKIVTCDAGAALMRTPKLASQIVKAMVKRVNIPVTVKIRTGWSDQDLNAIPMAQEMEQAGASGVTIHGRTKDQGYSGRANWNIIAKVKEKVTIPLIGNGDVVNGETALKLMDLTGCDGVMVGRAAMGNPWVFHQISCALKGKTPPPPPTGLERYKVFLTHLVNLRKQSGIFGAVHKMKKFASWYVKGAKGAPQARRELHSCKTSKEMIRIVKSVLFTQ